MQALIMLAVMGIVLLVLSISPTHLGLNEKKDWVDVLTALATPCIAATTGYIAFQQWETNEKVRKTVLSQRYFENYQKLEQAVKLVLDEGKPNREVQSYLFHAYSEAKVYLSKEIIEYTRDLFLSAFSLKTLLRELENEHLDPEEYDQKTKEVKRLKQIFLFSDHAEIYRKYLHIE